MHSIIHLLSSKSTRVCALFHFCLNAHPLERREIVNKYFAVQMIDFMLDTHSQQAVRVDFNSFAFFTERACQKRQSPSRADGHTLALLRARCQALRTSSRPYRVSTGGCAHPLRPPAARRYEGGDRDNTGY